MPGGVRGEQRHWERTRPQACTGPGSKTEAYVTQQSSGWGRMQRLSPQVEGLRTRTNATFFAATRALAQIPLFSFRRVEESRKKGPSPMCGSAQYRRDETQRALSSGEYAARSQSASTVP